MVTPRSRTRVKVCCISSEEEARLAVEAGADALGLVARMPSGPGPIPDERIRAIAAAVPPGVDTFLLTSETEAADVVDHVERCGTSVVQLVDRVDPVVYERLRSRTPAVRIVQVIHVEDESAILSALEVSRYCDAVLLDSGRPGAQFRELGGTGRAHDWNVSARIVGEVDRPVFLAGGLQADNVSEAMRAVRPWGLDLCSGVRTADRLDRARLEAFFEAVRAADRGAGEGRR